jgi:hypothetical protein
MTMIFSRLCGLAAGAVVAMGVVASALAQTAAAPASDQNTQPTGYQQTGTDANAAGPAGATRPLEVPILYVTGIEVLHAALDPKVMVVRVTGVTSSAGWSTPQLVPFFYGKPGDDVLDLQFIAASPEQSQKAEGFLPISASFELAADNPFKGVRVRAYANALELKSMTGTATAQPSKSDCKDCIGKKFVDKDKGQPGPGIIYGGDLPPDYRPIAPTHGVKGDVHNPNRINLILDADNKIVMAFWE